MSLHNYSKTPASNTAVNDGADAVSVVEGMARAAVNDAIRAMMSDLAKFSEDLGGLTTGGTGSAYTLTTNSPMTALKSGLTLVVKFTQDSADGATLNVNALGAKPIKARKYGGVSTVVADGIRSGDVLLVVYRDDAWNVVGIPPETVAPTAPGSEFIAASTASNSAVLGFAQFDATKYYGYEFKFIGVFPSETAGTSLTVRFSDDGGTNFISTTNYRWSGNEVIATAGSSSRYAVSADSITISREAQDSAGGVHGVAELLGPEATSDTHLTFRTSYLTTSQTSFVGSGRLNTSQVINAIQFAFASGDIASGTIVMYGLRK